TSKVSWRITPSGEPPAEDDDPEEEAGADDGADEAALLGAPGNSGRESEPPPPHAASNTLSALALSHLNCSVFMNLPLSLCFSEEQMSEAPSAEGACGFIT